MGLHEGLGAVGDVVERRAPGFVRFIAALRWGGLRSFRPDALTWTAELGAAVIAGIGLHRTITGLGRGRFRVPRWVVGVLGAVLTHLTVWRWDTGRWRRHRVKLVVELPLDSLVSLAADLDAAGLPVQRWERGVRSGRRVRGLWCRAGDVREVNRRIDQATAGGPGGPGAVLSR